MIQKPIWVNPRKCNRQITGVIKGKLTRINIQKPVTQALISKQPNRKEIVKNHKTNLKKIIMLNDDIRKENKL